ncbi:hypothetical protein F0U44_11535 [Nocardioides humilatus]|uniref:DUF11 domain-containing protein n=1 Tax=Nocardioides humilatus TaxID=2607660 RepID=A0A5B1LEK6_9ACTN|nr:hypothetical protein [Nocardioides humilatus]KAA1419085.1 hypothetical protein F0U44_11535 [Nocardioides humilatus]
MLRRLLVACVAGALVMLALVAPAEAVNLDGRLQVKGPGSVYTVSGATVSLATSPGKGVTFSLKVVNTGTSVAQYNVKVFADSHLTVEATTGSLRLTPLAVGPDGYFTAPIEPGAAQTIALKTTPIAGTTQTSLLTQVFLYATNNTSNLSQVILDTEIRAPKSSGNGYALYAHNGSQPFVGGDVSAQIATAPALKLGQTASYKVRLKNDSASSTEIGLYLDNVASCNAYYSTTVKAGSVDVTADAVSGHYVTPSLAPGKYKELTVAIKYVALAPSSCRQTFRVPYSKIGTTLLTEVYAYLMVHAAA